MQIVPLQLVRDIKHKGDIQRKLPDLPRWLLHEMGAKLGVPIHVPEVNGVRLGTYSRDP